MCGRFTLHARLAEIAAYFSASPRMTQLALRFNILPGQDVSVIRKAAENEITTMRWGLIPSWASGVEDNKYTYNARSETMAEKPTYRAAVKKCQRCIIPANGFFEDWKRRKDKPYYVKFQDDRLIGFAGLWDRWGDMESCTIITTEPNSLLKTFHHRMPVILPQSAYESWLNPTDKEIGHFIQSYSANDMTAYPVRVLTSEAERDSKEAVKKLQNEQLNLFPDN